MDRDEYEKAFAALTGNRPFPWQWRLYAEHFVRGEFPGSCTLPTGLGKTNVIAVWLLALATAPAEAKVPRRLVYVVNRRTVVDQSTDVTVQLREKLLASPPELVPIADALKRLCALPTEVPLAISTLRGQFADNREWSADPARPAVVVGTVDLVGSRLLFSGYGCGFKTRPLHAGFLGQDALLVHDEAHLEQPFQQLLTAIEREQRDGERVLLPWPKLRVMALTATPRGDEAFGLTDEDRADDVVKVRTGATKALHLPELNDPKRLAEQVAGLAEKYEGTGRAVLVFVSGVGDVQKVADKLGKVAPGRVERLTGTLRGYERDRLATENRVFARFLPPSDRRCEPVDGVTVYLACTSAGEVGVNLSADDLVCDLSTFESMAQRFGRVNRFGERSDTAIHVVHPGDDEFDDDEHGRRQRTLALLRELEGDASPAALGRLRERADRAFAVDDAYSLPPVCVPTSDILFDAWALTTVPGSLPGRPPVADYLHGIEDETRYETQVAWREEVEHLSGAGYTAAELAELLEDYPLKPHEVLRDVAYRVFGELEAVAARDAARPEGQRQSAWVIDPDETVTVYPLAKLVAVDAKKKPAVTLAGRTVLLPPAAGGLAGGMLSGKSEAADDVADDWYEDRDQKVRRRVRVWDGDEKFEEKTAGMRLVRTVEVRAAGADDETEGRKWRWYARPKSADDDGSKSSREPVGWQAHTVDVTTNAGRIAAAVGLPDDLRKALDLAARFHDLGKRRDVWQRSIGNPDPRHHLAKSGGRMRPREITKFRHEFGSLLDAEGGAGLTDSTPAERDVVMHLIAAHHGYGRPALPADRVFDPERSQELADAVAREVPRRYARLQRRYGRWGLAYLESLLRAADYAASASPSQEEPS